MSLASQLLVVTNGVVTGLRAHLLVNLERIDVSLVVSFVVCCEDLKA